MILHTDCTIDVYLATLSLALQMWSSALSLLRYLGEKAWSTGIKTPLPLGADFEDPHVSSRSPTLVCIIGDVPSREPAIPVFGHFL